MKKLLTLALSALLVCSMVLPAMASAFPDVPENHWAYKAVEELYAAGLVIGYPDGTYGGQRSMTRYEYAMIVSRLYEKLQQIDAENLAAAKAAQEMAMKAQLAADAAANATPVERIIEKHIIETKPDVPYEEIAKQARDLAVLVESLRDEFSKEIDELGLKVADLDKRVTDLEERQTKTEADVAELKAFHEKIQIGGSFETKFQDVNASDAGYLNVEPYDTSRHPSQVKQGAKLESALTVDMGLKPAEGIDATASITLKDDYEAGDADAGILYLSDLALEVTSDGVVKRGYYGDIAGSDAFAGYSRFLKTVYAMDVTEGYDTEDAEGAQVDLAKGSFAGQVAVLRPEDGSAVDDTYYMLSRGEYTLNPAVTFGLSGLKYGAEAHEGQGIDRYGFYAKGVVADADYNFGYYTDTVLDAGALELAAARNFGSVDVTLDYTSDYAEDAFTMIGAETADGFALGSIPLSVYGEYGFANTTMVVADESHFKIGVKVTDYPLGILKVGGGWEFASKATSTSNEFEVARWSDTSDDYNKFSLDAGFDYQMANVKFTPGVELYTKSVTENVAGVSDHDDSRVTLKIGFESPMFTKGNLTGSYKWITDKAWDDDPGNNVADNSTANKLTLNYTYPVGAVDWTIGTDWVKKDTENDTDDYNYFLVKSGIKFDF